MYNTKHMKKNVIFTLLIGFFATLKLFATDNTSANKGYVVGNEAMNFNLKNIDGKSVSLDKYAAKAKGAIIIFTCNHCPFSKAYEDRIIALEKKYQPMGYPVIAINPNDPVAYPDDNFENMKIRAKEKGFTFPYLVDGSQEIAKTYGATKTPHVYLIDKSEGKNTIVYIGAIDDNSDDASAVKEKYLENAISALMKGTKPDPSSTKAIGCGIKWKK